MTATSMPKSDASAVGGEKDLESFVAEKDKARYDENQAIARKLVSARALAAEKDKQNTDLRKQLGLYGRIYESMTARKGPPEWLAPLRPKSHHAIPSLLLTDIHFDEMVQPDEVEGYNKYDRAIALMRIKRAFTKSVELSRTYISGVTFDGFNLFLGGDLFSGIIHEELLETNQAQLCDSIVTILDPLEAGINLLAKEFGHVSITAVVGNHGRRTKKPRSKFRARDNFDWLVYKLLERNMVGRKDVSIDVSPSADAMATIYGTRYRLTHGDQFQGGSGISGVMSPLLLGAHRKAKRQSAMGKPYDILVMGHWHQTLWLPGIIMGGSVVGYSEYSYLNNFLPEAPQSSFWLTTPEHGVTLQTTALLQNRAGEGW